MEGDKGKELAVIGGSSQEIVPYQKNQGMSTFDRIRAAIRNAQVAPDYLYTSDAAIELNKETKKQFILARGMDNVLRGVQLQNPEDSTSVLGKRKLGESSSS